MMRIGECAIDHRFRRNSDQGDDQTVEPADILERQRNFFASGKTRSVEFRLDVLRRLRQSILAHEADIAAALRADLNKSVFDSYVTETGLVLLEISHTLRHLHRWAKPQRAKTALLHFGASSMLYPEPHGLTLVMSPWNYPFMLALAPLVGAIAAGNCAVVKPSELSPETSKITAEIIREVFPPEYVAVVEGGVKESQELLANPFDYIFFTGSTPVGKVVMEAAAKHLTPVTLELGGKSPGIVHRDANLQIAARRIAWGKFLNAGQTCVAPDYLLVHDDVFEPFLTHLREAIKDLYSGDPLLNPDFPRIVNRRHFDRLTNLLMSGRVVIGGRRDEDRLRIEPTVLDGVDWTSPVMQEEIFGPVLPLLRYRDVDAMLATVRSQAKPLSLYLFTSDRHLEARAMKEIPFGGGCVNDAVLHLASPYLPFGGTGQSGMGAYHGKYSFDTFTHYKGVLRQTTRFDLPMRYGKTKSALGIMKRFLH